MSKECYIYVIESTSGHYKIGYSKDPKRRLKELQKTQGPFIYRLVAYIKLPSLRRAMKVESNFHEAFASVHTRGEWFELQAVHLIAVGQALERIRKAIENDVT